MRTTKHLFLTLGLIAALFGGLATAKPVSACSCIAGQTTQDNFDNSAAVFVGTVTEVVDGGTITMMNTVEFDVSRSWKGSVGAEITVATAQDSAACGFNFEEGQEYLVYAYESEGTMETGLCSGTASVADAMSAIAELNEITDGTNVPQPAESEEEMDDTTKSIVIAALSLAVGALLGYALGKRK